VGTFLARRLRGAAALAAGGALLSGCAAVRHSHSDDRALADARVGHVVLVSIDGLRPDAIEASGAETLQRLIQEGAYSLQARTIVPSKTLPSHTSMLTGVSPAKHGVTWNEDRVEETGRVAVPTVFDLADSAGLRTAAFFGKAKFRHLVGTESLDYWATAPRGMEIFPATRMVEDVKRLVKYRSPQLLFIHIPDPDLAGHSAGWMTLPYRLAVRRADAAVREIWEIGRKRFGDDFVLIVTADHGGHERTHGTEAAVDMTIPWIVWGKGVKPGRITRRITTYDTAATTLWLLGIRTPAFWDGSAVTEAFIPAALLPAAP
jgi:predicted AlkP superfamily pyrophosphatase or phosphodiesterase